MLALDFHVRRPEGQQETSCLLRWRHYWSPACFCCMPTRSSATTTFGLLYLRVLFVSVSDVHVRYIVSPVRLSSVCRSVVCNVRAPYSDGSNFRQYFYGIRYLGHPSTENFTEIVPGNGDRPRETPPPGELNTRGIAKYSEPIDAYISETVQDRR